MISELIKFFINATDGELVDVLGTCNASDIEQMSEYEIITKVHEYMSQCR